MNEKQQIPLLDSFVQTFKVVVKLVCVATLLAHNPKASPAKSLPCLLPDLDGRAAEFDLPACSVLAIATTNAFFINPNLKSSLNDITA